MLPVFYTAITAIVTFRSLKKSNESEKKILTKFSYSKACDV